MVPDERSPAVAIVLALVLVSSGCLGTLPPDGTTEATSTAPDGAATTGDEPTTDAAQSTTDTDRSTETVPSTTDATRSATATDEPTTERTTTVASDDGRPPLEIAANAVWVPPSSSDDQQTRREYIAIERNPFVGNRFEPFNVSGFTVTYGTGPTYTIPENMSLNISDGRDAIYVFTGAGEDRVYPPRDLHVARRKLLLHAGQEAPIVTRNGTTVTLRNRTGSIVDQQTVTPVNGSAPLVPTEEYARALSNDSLESFKSLPGLQRATPFTVRAPTDLPDGYRFSSWSMADRLGRLMINFDREANNVSDNIFFRATAPQAIDEVDRPPGSRAVTVGNRTGYYATTDSSGSVLRFMGSNGWGYHLRGPIDEQAIIRIAESIATVDGNTTVATNATTTPGEYPTGQRTAAPSSSG